MFSDRCLQFVNKKKIMVRILDIVRIFAKSGDREVVAQIGSLPIKSGGLECSLTISRMIFMCVYDAMGLI